jgi:hypothetical protein
MIFLMKFFHTIKAEGQRGQAYQQDQHLHQEESPLAFSI